MPFSVERDGRALLIDAGLGPEKITAEPDSPVGAGHGGTLLDNLGKVGRAPSEIETVAITHLHPDHIGWAWHPEPGTDRPAFTNADYVLAEPEWAARDALKEEMVDALAPRARTGDAAPGESYLVRTVHKLRGKPIGSLESEDLRIMISQKVGLEALVPVALERLERDPLLEGDYYPGDLLVAVLRAKVEYWMMHPAELETIQRILNSIHSPEDDVAEDIRNFRERLAG